MWKTTWMFLVLTALPAQAAVNFEGTLIKPPAPRVAVAPSSRQRTFDGGDFVIRVPDGWYAVGREIPLGSAMGRLVLNFGPQAAAWGGLTVITERHPDRSLSQIVSEGKGQQAHAIARFKERCDCVELVGNGFHDYLGPEGQVIGYWYDYRLQGETRRAHDFYRLSGETVYQVHLFHHPEKLTERDVLAIVGSFRVRS